MKNSKKYVLIVVAVFVGAILLVSGNAGAVIVAPQSGAVIGSAPMVSPVFGSGIAPGVSVAPKSAGVPFVRPFFPFFFPFFNPFFDVDIDPFFGFAEFD